MKKAKVFDKIIDKICNNDALIVVVCIAMGVFLFGVAVSCWIVDSKYSVSVKVDAADVVGYDALEVVNVELAKRRAEREEPEVEVELELENIKDVDEEVTEETTTVEEPLVEIEPVVEAAPEATPMYYDVPLSNDLQDYIFKLCAEHGIDPAIVISMIETESTFKSGAINYNGTCFGLMQVYADCHRERMAKLNCYNLLNPYENVAVGIDILAELYATGNSEAWVLMVYNGGYGYANDKISRGEISDYALTVMSRSKTLIKV